MDGTGEHHLKLFKTSLKKPKPACFLSYMEQRPNTNISNIMKTSQAKRRSHTRGKIKEGS
jgi:hypothetical protein